MHVSLVLLVNFSLIIFCFGSRAVFHSTVSRSMALSGDKRDGGELRVFVDTDELSTDLADYIAELSEASVKERGVFAIALSGGSLISLMGYRNCIFVSVVLFFSPSF